MKYLLFLSIFFLFLFQAKDCTAQTQTQTIKLNLVLGTNRVSLGKITSLTRDIHGVMLLSDETNRCVNRYNGNRITRYQNYPKSLHSLRGAYPECKNTDAVLPA